ncbi:uncharacterized protein LOC127249315 [Andrographis paniculata]|uniref:uncharacterized protein LOC127249315 n=1 Tax=Andrographis paniculata TaxID=175694 RepID=UPI0021E702E7|nr:uncharacterized protein LOC127249315 [Andrographis paniculata]
MGCCFLTCLGIESTTKNPKRRTRTRRSSPQEQPQDADASPAGEYVPLRIHGGPPKIDNSDDELREEQSQKGALPLPLPLPLLSKIKKKVRFNLDAHNCYYYQQIVENEEEEEEDKTTWEPHPASIATLSESSTWSQAANRYQNCRENYEEEEEEEEDDDDDELNFDRSDGEEDSNNDDIEDDDDIPTKANLNPTKSDMFNVLTPVQNLAQWKSVKSKGRLAKNYSEELRGQDISSSKNLSQPIAVDLSLSNWLGSVGT